MFKVLYSEGKWVSLSSFHYIMSIPALLSHPVLLSTWTTSPTLFFNHSFDSTPPYYRRSRSLNQFPSMKFSNSGLIIQKNEVSPFGCSVTYIFLSNRFKGSYLIFECQNMKVVSWKHRGWGDSLDPIGPKLFKFKFSGLFI